MQVLKGWILLLAPETRGMDIEHDCDAMCKIVQVVKGSILLLAPETRGMDIEHD